MKNKKAIITLETTVLLAICAIALLSMTVYFKRSLQGNWRTNIDSFSAEQFGNEGYTGEISVLSSLLGVDVGIDSSIEQTYSISTPNRIIVIPGWQENN